MQKLKVGAISRNYFNMPFWIAIHQNFFLQEGLNVEVELFEPIDEVWRRLKSGYLDIALGVTEQIILDREAGGDLEIVGGNVNRLPFSFITAKDVTTFEQLRGRTIGVSSIKSGSSSLVMKIMSAHGLEYPADYTLEEVGPILARWDMLQCGKIAGGLQGAPLNYIALDQGFHSLCEPRDQFPWFQFTSLNVSSTWANQHRETMIAFLRAFIRAHEWFYANREGCREIAMRETGITAEYADRAWDEYTRDEIFPKDGRANPSSIDALIETSALIRELPTRALIRAEHYINHGYWEAASTTLLR